MNAATPGSGWRAAGQLLAQPKYPGDEGLAVFFLEHHRLLRRYLIAQGCADSDSDDIVQDAFLIVRQRWATIAYYDKPKALCRRSRNAGRTPWMAMTGRLATSRISLPSVTFPPFFMGVPVTMGSGGDVAEIEIRLVASAVHCTCTVRFNRSHFTVTVIRDGGGGFALLASSLGVRACAANIHVNALT